MIFHQSFSLLALAATNLVGHATAKTQNSDTVIEIQYQPFAIVCSGKTTMSTAVQTVTKRQGQDGYLTVTERGSVETTVTIPPVDGRPGTVIVKTTLPTADLDRTTTTEPGPIATATTVPPKDGQPGTITIVRPYTGSIPITAPTTVTTISASGTAPGTVIVETPSPSTTGPSTITITRPYTGTVPITAATTVTTIPASGTAPGTVIVETPNPSTTGPPLTTTPPPSTSTGTTTTTETPTASTVTITRSYSSTSIITKPVTVTTIPATGTAPATVIIETPLPTYPCNSDGYLISSQNLYILQLGTGQPTLIKNDIGNGQNVNSIGYNSFDNYLYGFATPMKDITYTQLIRIGADGNIFRFNTTIPVTHNFPMGDVDDKGQFWVGAHEGPWAQIDLNPQSPTYAQVVDSGTAQVPNLYINDWSFVPGHPGKLYTINSNGQGAQLWTFDTTSHTYAKVRDYGGLTLSQPRDTWGALYATGSSELLGADNEHGFIYKFPLGNDGEAVKLANGPPATGSDGARCIKAP